MSDNGGQSKSAAKAFIKDFFAGGVGGMCTVISGHPFDTIKVRKNGKLHTLVV